MNNKKLGEVTKETRTLRTHLNGYYPTETAVMEYRSDYLGRMQWIVYPDGEKVTYGYDQGGQVVSVRGEHYGHEFNYVTNILYDEYGQRTRIDYGNGTFTEYKYDPERRWLDTIKTENKWGQSYQNISYSFDAVGNVLGYENNCLDNVTGNYKTRQTYSYDNLYQLIRVEGETTYNPYRSSVPEFVSNYSQDFVFDSDGLGNMTSKVSKESVRPNKKIGDNLNYNFTYVYDENYAHRLVRAGDRYYKYDANGNIICEQDGSFDSNGDDTAYHKIEQETDDVYSTDYGWGLFKEDKTGSTTSRYRRTYTWNERNQLVSSVDANYSTAYVYGQDGQRSNKYTGNSETLYFNKMWTHHTDSGNSIYGGQTSKNIYLGETRIVTKLNSGEDPTYQEEYYKQYYYHSDHLGCIKVVQKANSVIIKNEEIINVVQKKININELDSSLIVLTNNQKYNINVKMFSQKDIDYLILLLEMYINSTTDEVMDNDINNIGNTSKKIIQEIVCGSLELMLLYEIIAVILFLPCRFIIYYFNINESIPKALPSIADIFLFLMFIITLKFHRQFANYLTMLGISIKVKIIAFIFLFLIFILVGIIFNI